MKSINKIKLLSFSILFSFAITSVAHHEGDHEVELNTNDRWEECSMDISAALTQSQWRKASENFASILYFKPTNGAKPLGKAKFNVSLEMSQTRIEDYDGSWNNTFSHPDDDHYLTDENHQLTLPLLTARVGITNEIDAGIMYTKAAGANYGWTGLDVKYAFYHDGNRGLYVATRLSAVVLNGVEDFDYYQGATDLLVSKELGWFTPYAGITGIVSTASEDTDEVNLKRENVASVLAIVGTEFQWKYLSAAAEADFSRDNTYTVRIGATF